MELAAVVVTAPSRAAELLDGNRPSASTAWIAIGKPTAPARWRERGLTPATAAQPTPEALATRWTTPSRTAEVFPPGPPHDTTIQ
ncbi:hypothetical protein QJS66_22365 [Kocuria rhizophila]|nr:hypothetical protein QJS66_22365 [Kocuria rhizophila]